MNLNPKDIVRDNKPKSKGGPKLDFEKYPVSVRLNALDVLDKIGTLRGAARVVGIQYKVIKTFKLQHERGLF